MMFSHSYGHINLYPDSEGLRNRHKDTERNLNSLKAPITLACLRQKKKDLFSKRATLSYYKGRLNLSNLNLDINGGQMLTFNAILICWLGAY